MMQIIRFIAVLVLCQSFMGSFTAMAEGDVPTEQEIKQAEGEPPVIPHKVADTDTARECLKCHRDGKRGAPVTSHPERKICTQCHVPADGVSAEGSGKSK